MMMGIPYRARFGGHAWDVDYEMGDEVYLRCRDDPVRGLITGFYLRPSSCVIYIVAWGNTGHESQHYGLELSDRFEPRYDTAAGGTEADAGEG